MDVQFGRRQFHFTPRFGADGLTGTFAALGLAFAAVWPIVGPKLQLHTTDARHTQEAIRFANSEKIPRAETPAAVASPSPSPAIAESALPDAPPRSPQQAAAPNLPPVIQSVRVRGGTVTAASNIRLDVGATDADGDPLTLRTRWTINDQPVETEAAVLPKSLIRRGDRIAAVVVAHDGNGTSEPFAIQVTVANAVPMIKTFPAGFDATGAFVYAVGAVDPDGDADLRYELVEGPTGMHFEPQDGTLRWSPAAEQTGRHPVRLDVRDALGGVDRQAFDLRVGPGHVSPSSLADGRVKP